MGGYGRRRVGVSTNTTRIDPGSEGLIWGIRGMGRARITAGDWRIPTLIGAGQDQTGPVVITGYRGAEIVVADCRNRLLTPAEMLANAELIARAPRMRAALRRIEMEVGDMPAGVDASRLYDVVLSAMRHAGVDNEEGEE